MRQCGRMHQLEEESKMSNTESTEPTSKSVVGPSTGKLEHPDAKAPSNKHQRAHEIKAELKAKALREGVGTADPARSFANWNKDQATPEPRG